MIHETFEHPVEVKALLFASAAHASIGQKRKYTGEDYIVHPIEVAGIVRTVPGFTPQMVAAALLHDVVEDTKGKGQYEVTIADIRREFGDEIADMVSDLTDVAELKDGNRAARKAINRNHSANASGKSQTIKCADVISNTKSIAEHDPNFARVYIPEISLLLSMMTKGDPDLHKQATELVIVVASRLNINLTMH